MSKPINNYLDSVVDTYKEYVKNGEVIGHWVSVEVEKSRVCKPYQKTKFKLLYE